MKQRILNHSQLGLARRPSLVYLKMIKQVYSFQFSLHMSVRLKLSKRISCVSILTTESKETTILKLFSISQFSLRDVLEKMDVQMSKK